MSRKKRVIKTEERIQVKVTLDFWGWVLVILACACAVKYLLS